MPAKKQTTREDILNAAFALVRERGIDKLNARELAKRCGCSTQPIYLSFNGIDEIKEEVFKMACREHERFTGGVIASNAYPQYKSVGMAYALFAKEEKELFKFLFMRDEDPSLQGVWFENCVDFIAENLGFDREQAERLQSEMWIFVHGVAVMYATGFYEWDTETLSGMLSDVFLGVMNYMRGKK